MAASAPIALALGLPNGARFYRCALQVNPETYAHAFRGMDHGKDATTYAQELIAKCVEVGIHVLAVTDHNNVAGISAIQRAADASSIPVFPGFEVSSTEGVHVLCIYPLDTATDALQRFLGELGIRGLDPNTELTNKPFTELLACVKEQGGLTIAAHVTQDKGLLTTLHGQARARAWKDVNLRAVQIPGSVEDSPNDKKGILKNRDEAHRRERPAASDLAIAVVNAKDIAAADDLDDPAASCWIKMSSVSLEGLRQAFLDPESRIRLSSDPEPETHTELVALAWEGGFLSGASIHFNENLNVLVGGRGAGKSTVVESLRYVLGLEPIGDDAHSAHDGIVNSVLKAGTKISLLVRSCRPALREYIIERTVPNPPVVRDSDGQVLQVTPEEVIPTVEVFGQHEIAELTKSRLKLTYLLDRFLPAATAGGRGKPQLLRDLEQSRERLLSLDRDIRIVRDRLAKLPAIEETLKRFKEAGVEELLKDQTLLVQEEQLFLTAAERLEPFKDILESLRRAFPLDRAFLDAATIDPLPAKDVLHDVDLVLQDLNDSIQAAGKGLAASLKKAEGALAALKARWEVRQRAVEEEYAKILRKLQKEKVDGEEFMRLRRQLEELRPLRDRETGLARDVDEAGKRRIALLAEWEETKRLEFARYERAARSVTRQLAGRVRVQVSFARNREPLYSLMKQRIGGQLARALEVLNGRPDLSLRELVDASRAGRDELVKRFGLPAGAAEKISSAPPEVLMRIEELDLPHETKIELNVAPEGEPQVWTELEALSTGQKATAVLLLLLLESEGPLVVDQPEDDLDNRFITEGVVPKMREEKRRRQFVFSTHNANIPVLGDAELIVGLRPSGEAGLGRAEIPEVLMGSIDSAPIRSLVGELLEGGKEAFERRRMKYGY